MTDDSFVLNIIRGYKIPTIENVYQNKTPEVPRFSKHESRELRVAVDKLLEIGAVEPCRPTPGQFISSYFLVPKSDGTYRFILNLKKFNNFMHTDHFKLEDIKLAANLLHPSDFMCKLDLKDAFFLVSVNGKYRKYLRFSYNNKLWQFTCLPFGLCSCPFIFTKILKPVIHTLRSQGITVIIYLDDMLLIAKTAEKCRNDTQKAIELLQSLGFIINFEKSKIVPSRCCTFLGFTINSETMRLSLPLEKRTKINNLLKTVIKENQCKIELMAKLAGVLSSACLAVKYGWLYYKSLERDKYLALKANKGNMKAIAPLSVSTIRDLHWWKQNIFITYNPIRKFTFKKEIFSDASLTGWGAAFKDQRAHGFWTSDEKQMHINFLEIKAAHFALKHLASNDENCQILLRVDNNTAIAYINKMGGIKFPNLNSAARDLWQWCEARGIWVFAEYIASKDNTDADAESRISNIDTEWELSSNAFRKIVEIFGQPYLDLFASRINKKCSHYCSWEFDPDAISINAFTCSWGNKLCYAFPPFSLMPRVLKKIREDEASVIVVAPFWPGQAWYPEFERLAVEQPIIFQPSNDLLLSPYRNLVHPLASQLSLIVGMLCGKPFRRKIFQNQP